MRAGNSSAGPKPSSNCCHSGTRSGGLALTVTFFDSRSCTNASSANAGRWVVKSVTCLASFSPGGYAAGLRKSPSMLSPVDVISLTFPACTCWRKNVYDTVVRFGPNIAEANSQLTTRRMRMTHQSRRKILDHCGGEGFSPSGGGRAPSTRHGGRSSRPPGPPPPGPGGRSAASRAGGRCPCSAGGGPADSPLATLVMVAPPLLRHAGQAPNRHHRPVAGRPPARPSASASLTGVRVWGPAGPRQTSPQRFAYGDPLQLLGAGRHARQVRSFVNAGLNLAYDVIGDGFPVVLHTGAAGDSRMWRDARYVAGLTGFQVILLDHRGHGQSDAPRGPHDQTVADYAADVLALADELALEHFAFWGYSNGARVGYELAATQQRRIAALVASGGVDAPDDDPNEWHEAAQAVRSGGIRAILGDEATPG